MAQIANEQSRMMSMIEKLESVSVVATEGEQDGDWLDGQLDMMGEFE